jgi:hypothetical protein
VSIPTWGGPAEEVDVWPNPWRHQGLYSPRPARESAARALRDSRIALAESWPTADEYVWRQVAEHWLAAGLLDRAALAYGYAEDPSSRVWVRSDAARARLDAGLRLAQPQSTAWKHI